MLTREDLKLNFLALFVISKLNFIPVKFNAVTGGMSTQTSIPRLVIFHIWRWTSIVHTGFVVGRTLYFTMILTDLSLPLEQIGIMIVLSVGFVAALLVNYWAFISWIQLDIKLFKLLFNLHEVESWTRKRKGRKSLRELLVCNFPVTFFTLGLAYPVLYAVVPDIPILLAYSLPSAWQGAGTTIVCAILETTLHLFCLANCYHPVYFIVAFILTFMENIEREIQNVSVKNLQENMKALQRLVLQLSLYNLVFGHAVFVTKIVALECAILGGFSSVRLWPSTPLFAFIYTVFSMDGIIFYLGMYNRAYRVTDKILDFRTRILVTAQNLREKSHRDEVRTLTKAIRPLGIQCGDFHVFEREAVPIFINFVAQQIASLLLAY